MSLILCKHPGVKMSFMVPKEDWPETVGILERFHCSYTSEEEVEPTKGDPYVVIRDIRSRVPMGGEELFNAIMAISNFTDTNKFYVMITPRNGGKKNVRKNWKKANAGSEVGDSGEPAGDTGSEQDSGRSRRRLVSSVDDVTGIRQADAEATDDYNQ